MSHLKETSDLGFWDDSSIFLLELVLDWVSSGSQADPVGPGALGVTSLTISKGLMKKVSRQLLGVQFDLNMMMFVLL